METKIKKDKVERIFSVIRDKSVLAELNKSVKPDALAKAEEIKNGFWAIASMEVMDSDGDIVMIDGIDCSGCDPEMEKYLPILAQHKRSTQDASPTQIGRIEMLQKTSIGGTPALAMYFTFALDDNGEPMDDLVAKYYKRYVKNYSNAFSVGCDVYEAEEIPDAGYRYTKTKLQEVSCVTFGANPNAVGLTRSVEVDEVEALDKKITALTELVQKQTDIINKQSETISAMNLEMGKAVAKSFEPLIERLDAMEASWVVVKTNEKPVEQPKKQDIGKELVEQIDKVLKAHR